MTIDCFFLGGSSVDYILEVPRMPNPDEKMLAKLAGIVPGGLVANAACASARLGLSTAWAGTIGSDEAGARVISDFKNYGVETTWVEFLEGQTTDFCVILLDPSHERSILIVNTTPNIPTGNNELLRAVTAASLIYLIPQKIPFFELLVKAKQASNMRIAVDLEAGRGLSDEEMQYCIQHADIIFCNREALKKYSGEAEALAGAQQWLDQGAQVVVVTLGSQGAWAIQAQEQAYHPGFSVPVVDTTGAGDCFHAAFLCGIHSNWPLKKTIQFANAAAAISVQYLGARGFLPNQEDVLQFLKEHAPVALEEFKDYP